MELLSRLLLAFGLIAGVFTATPAVALCNSGNPMLASTDTDGDGVSDACDNCIDLPNPQQQDDDADGAGNRCDADLDNSAEVSREATRSMLNTVSQSSDSTAAW
jgi:hypothetical protein